MSVELEAKKVIVAAAQKDCEELLVEIVSERRVADDQKKQASKPLSTNAFLCPDHHELAVIKSRKPSRIP